MDNRNPPSKYDEYLKSISTIEGQRKAYITETTKTILNGRNKKTSSRVPSEYIGGIAVQMAEAAKNRIDIAVQKSIYTAYGVTRAAPEGSFNRGINFDHIHRKEYAARQGF